MAEHEVETILGVLPPYGSEGINIPQCAERLCKPGEFPSITHLRREFSDLVGNGLVQKKMLFDHGNRRYFYTRSEKGDQLIAPGYTPAIQVASAGEKPFYQPKPIVLRHIGIGDQFRGIRS